jgi:transposase
MEILIDRGCGLDVHKESVVAAIEGKGIKKETKTYSTMTNDLFKMKKWLKEQGVTHVAMESTGSYWKPIFNILEDTFVVFLVNPRHIKNVPGRKTDVKDSEWICKLLMRGLLSPSFIPPLPIRQLRDLTRYRKKLVREIASEKNRIQKILEDGNIKLSSVVSDVFGVSGRKMIGKLLDGRPVEEMVEAAHGRLKKKKDNLKEALTGYFLEHHRKLVTIMLGHIKSLTKNIEEVDKSIKKILKDYRNDQKLLTTIPGVNETGAATIIAEMGVDMSQFPSEQHAASWAGMCPGNNESAGKKKPGHITQGNKALKAVLTECGWAASRTKNTYLAAKYYSLVGRRGKKKALIAVGHKILTISYFILRYKVPYKELGGDYLDQRRKKSLAKGYQKKLERLGYTVQLTEAA